MDRRQAHRAAERDLPDVDCLVMGSDFPHAEGVAEPLEFTKLVETLTPEQQRKFLRENAMKLFPSVA